MRNKHMGFLFILIAFGLSLMSFQLLPEEIPIHWNINGVADRFQHKSLGAFILPVFMFGLFIILRFLPRIDPRKDNYARFTNTYHLMLNGILLFMLLVHIMALSYSLGLLHNTNYYLHILLGLFFIFLGNYMPKVKQNYFIGIRTPWAIADGEVWRKTHRFGGKIFVITGFLFIGIIFLPSSLQAISSILVLGVSLITIFLSSYFFYARP